MGREVDGLLRYVLDRVAFDRPFEPLDGLLGLLRPDHNLLATIAAPALDDQFPEVLRYVPALLRYCERPRRRVLYQRLLTEVSPDHLRHEGLDSLVVHDLRVGGEEDVYPALYMTIHELRQVCVEGVLVYSLVDDVYPASCRLVYKIAAPVERKVFGLRQDRTHLLRVDVVVEIKLVSRPAGHDRERCLGPFRGRCPQGVAQATEPAIQRANLEFLERAGEEDLSAHPAAPGHGCESHGHLGVLLKDEVLPAAGLTAALALDRHDVEGYLPDRHLPEAVGEGWIVEYARLQHLLRHDLSLAGLEPAQILVYGLHPLDEASLQALPIRGGDDAREPIGGVGLVSLRYAEGALLVQKQAVRPAEVLFPALGAGLRQLFEEGTVYGARHVVGPEDLVGPWQCAFEYDGSHRMGIIRRAFLKCRCEPGSRHQPRIDRTRLRVIETRAQYSNDG